MLITRSDWSIATGARLTKRSRRTSRRFKLRPDYTVAYERLGSRYLRSKKFNEAVEVFRQLAALKPGDAIAPNNMGEAYFELNRLNEACESFRQSIRLKPDYGKAYYNLGRPPRHGQSRRRPRAVHNPHQHRPRLGREAERAHQSLISATDYTDAQNLCNLPSLVHHFADDRRQGVVLESFVAWELAVEVAAEDGVARERKAGLRVAGFEEVLAEQRGARDAAVAGRVHRFGGLLL